MKNQSLLFILCTFLLVTGCSDNFDVPPEQPDVSTVLVTNEGNFGDSNGSVTSFDPETGSTIQQAFANANGRPLAGIIQSTTIINERLFIVLNNADKIEVVDPNSFTSVGTIEVSSTPVAIVSDGNGQAYVSNLYANNVSIINLETLEETGETISVGANPQAMVRVDSRIYVANNGFGNDNTLSVINIQTGAVESTITVGNGPTEMIVDQAGQIWVVCNGLIAYDEDFNRDPENDVPGSLFIIDGDQAAISGSINTGGNPVGLAINEQIGRGYLLNDGVQIINLNTTQFQGESFTDRSFNAIAYSPAEQLIYAAQSNGFTQAGQVLRYNLNATAIDSFSVGIAPNGFQFSPNL